MKIWDPRRNSHWLHTPQGKFSYSIVPKRDHFVLCFGPCDSWYENYMFGRFEDVFRVSLLHPWDTRIFLGTNTKTKQNRKGNLKKQRLSDMGDIIPQGKYSQDQESWVPFYDHALSSHLITGEALAQREDHWPILATLAGGKML